MGKIVSPHYQDIVCFVSLRLIFEIVNPAIPVLIDVFFRIFNDIFCSFDYDFAMDEFRWAVMVVENVGKYALIMLILGLELRLPEKLEIFISFSIFEIVMINSSEKHGF